MDNNNLWMYSDSPAQHSVACGLIAFGAESFKRAKIVTDINLLESVFIETRKNGVNEFVKNKIYDFASEYLIDTIRIITFFENYMKAELIIRNYLVHSIKNKDGFKPLAAKQKKEPVNLKEVNDIKPFIVNETEKTIQHEYIANHTISFSSLVGSQKYVQHYLFDETILQFIKELNIYRNSLHLHHQIPFETSLSFIENIKRLDVFVDYAVSRMSK